MRMKLLQSYLRTLLQGNEITKAEIMRSHLMRPKNAKPARTHGLAKFHKEFLNIPKFRPIIDTTGTSYCLVDKYLAGLLHQLTINELSLKHSFDAANRIKRVPSYLFENGYQYVSFDVKSLLTNIPIKQTVEIILRRIYPGRVISRNLKKTNFKETYLRLMYQNSVLVQQQVLPKKDDVSISFSLGSVLANIIMTELEDVIIKPLIADGTSFIVALMMKLYWKLNLKMLVRYIKLLINLMIWFWQLICSKMKYLTFYTLNCHQME